MRVYRYTRGTLVHALPTFAARARTRAWVIETGHSETSTGRCLWWCHNDLQSVTAYERGRLGTTKFPNIVGPIAAAPEALGDALVEAVSVRLSGPHRQ